MTEKNGKLAPNFFFFSGASGVQVKGLAFSSFQGFLIYCGKSNRGAFEGTLSHRPGFVEAAPFQSIRVDGIVRRLCAHAFHLPGLLF